MRIVAFCATLLISLSTNADWKVIERANPDGPGKAVDAMQDGRVVARLIYGEGQIKPYLHAFGESGELLTNGGTDKEGKPTGQFPHHRGIFIGWKINSELGTDDLWHITRGCKMELVKVEKAESSKDAAHIIADIAWRSARATNGSDLLLREKRSLLISRPDGKQTQIDASFTLTPARHLRLAGDLQHSGVHFRAHNEVNGRQAETTYLLEPEGKAKGNDLKWCRLVFPVGKQFYSAIQLNHPSNPVEELSTRKYGRFGYFFKKALNKGEELGLRYRFIIQPVDGPAETAPARKECGRAYEQFAKLR